jgi:hypothetical protein
MQVWILKEFDGEGEAKRGEGCGQRLASEDRKRESWMKAGGKPPPVFAQECGKDSKQAG